MNPKITADHLARDAVVYIRQSTMAQVAGNTESQRRQYALADQAKAAGFSSVTTIDDDLGRSGSGQIERPGFQKLVAAVCGGRVGAVYCIEASRLARNGRDWHHLIDLCALAGALVIDPDGIYDPQLINDRLLLGLKGTMSEYELSLLRQRGLAARDSKARRGKLRFTCRLATAGARRVRLKWIRMSGWPARSIFCSESSGTLAVVVRFSCGRDRHRSSCPSCAATWRATRSNGKRRPTTRSCRCSEARSMLGPMPLVEHAIEPMLLIAVRARPMAIGEP